MSDHVSHVLAVCHERHGARAESVIDELEHALSARRAVFERRPVRVHPAVLLLAAAAQSAHHHTSWRGGERAVTSPRGEETEDARG